MKKRSVSTSVLGLFRKSAIDKPRMASFTTQHKRAELEPGLANAMDRMIRLISANISTDLSHPHISSMLFSSNIRSARTVIRSRRQGMVGSKSHTICTTDCINVVICSGMRSLLYRNMKKSPKHPLLQRRTLSLFDGRTHHVRVGHVQNRTFIQGTRALRSARRRPDAAGNPSDAVAVGRTP